MCTGCRDCETVPEQSSNKPGIVSQSQCTPPQCKQISFGIENESQAQGQSSTKFIEILKVEYLIICIICDTDLVNKLILQMYTLHKYK